MASIYPLEDPPARVSYMQELQACAILMGVYFTSDKGPGSKPAPGPCQALQ